MSTPSHNPRELKIDSPAKFNGDSTKANIWLNSVRTYLHINRDIYDDGEKQVVFALSFMKEGPADVWADTYRNKCLAHSPVNFGTFTEFTSEFKSSFIHEDTKSNAITWLTATKVSKELPLNDYISMFQNKVSTSEITDQSVLINYFAVGIPSFLMRRIMSMDTVPAKIDDWYAKAIHFKTQWERADVLASKKPFQNTQRTYHHPQRPNPTPRDPNAMDIDAMQMPQKLTEEERQRCMRERLCLKCRKAGHMARECRTQFTPRPNTTPQIARIEEVQEAQEGANISEIHMADF